MAEDRTQEAMDHLQRAGLEMIAALRAVLDVAEEALRDPKGLVDLVTTTAAAAAKVASQASQASQATGQAMGQAGHAQRKHGVEHIRIS